MRTFHFDDGLQFNNGSQFSFPFDLVSVTFMRSSVSYFRWATTCASNILHEPNRIISLSIMRALFSSTAPIYRSKSDNNSRHWQRQRWHIRKSRVNKQLKMESATCIFYRKTHREQGCWCSSKRINCQIILSVRQRCVIFHGICFLFCCVVTCDRLQINKTTYTILSAIFRVLHICLSHPHDLLFNITLCQMTKYVKHVFPHRPTVIDKTMLNNATVVYFSWFVLCIALFIHSNCIFARFSIHDRQIDRLISQVNMNDFTEMKQKNDEYKSIVCIVLWHVFRRAYPTLCINRSLSMYFHRTNRSDVKCVEIKFKAFKCL